MEGKHFGHIVDLVIAVILMFLIPTIYFQQKKDNIIQNHVEQNTYHAVDTITTSGYITKELYDSYLYGLSTTNELYDVKIEAKERILEPEYRMKTVDEIIGEHNNAWNGSNTYTYVPVYSQTPTINESVDLSGLTTDTNDSVLRNSIRTGADPNHVHTAECFDGHIHEGEPYFYHQHAHTTRCIQYRSMWYLEHRCNNCGKNIVRFMASWYWDVNTNSIATGSSDTSQIRCSNCGSTNTTKIRDINGYGYSCGYDIDKNKDNLGDIIPVGQIETYKSPFPETSVRSNYVNGCYSYHVSNVYNTSRYYNESNKRFRYSNLSSTLNEFRNNGYQKYCTIPRMYVFTAYRNGDAVLSVSYQAEILSSGEVRLRLFAATYSKYGYRITNHTIPELITFDQAYQLYGIRVWFLNSMIQYAPSVAIPNQDNQWDNVTFDMVGWDDFYWCDHGVGDTWIKTCGYEDGSSTVCNGNLNHSMSGTKTLIHYNNDMIRVDLDYHVYQCNSCNKAIITLNYRKNNADQSLQDIYIGEIPVSKLSTVDQLIGRIETHTKTNGLYANGDGTYKSMDGMNYLGQVLGTKLYSLWDTKYKDSTSVIKENGTYYIRSLTKYSSGGTIQTRTIRHMPLKEVSLINGTYVCNEIVRSIAPTHRTQTKYQNTEIVRCITVTFMDGSTMVALSNTTFQTSAIGRGQIATLTYYAKDTKTTWKNFQTTATIHVFPRNKVCSNGHTYLIGSNGVDPGCIYCKEFVRYIEVVEPSDKKLTLKRGQALSEADIFLRAWYYDGHVDNLRTGFLHNYDKNYVGIQTVTLGYKGRYETLQVTVTVNTKRCNICNRFYDLMPDDTDMGCPYCASLVPVFTGQLMEYYNVIPHDEIMKVIYDDNSKYKLQNGDYITFTVKNRTKTTGMKLLDQLFGASHAVSMKYGSKIRDTR